MGGGEGWVRASTGIAEEWQIQVKGVTYQCGTHGRWEDGITRRHEDVRLLHTECEPQRSVRATARRLKHP
jgi:hypothetical protein